MFMGINQGKLTLPTILLLYLCLTGLVSHIFIDNLHQLELWGIMNQAPEHRAAHNFNDLYDHEDDVLPFTNLSARVGKYSGMDMATSRIQAVIVSISPLLPPPKVI